MNLNDVITAAGARISGGDPYTWECYGENANFLEFQDVKGKGYAHVIYDTKDYNVYEIHVEVPETEQCFRWLNSKTKEAFYKESERRGVNPNNAWDEVGYIHVETEELILEYLENIGELIYFNLPDIQSSAIDGKVSVPIDLSNEEMLMLMTKAHEADMTLNQFAEKILREMIERHKQGENLILPMPGTIGGAKIIFEEDNMKKFTVKLDVRYVLEVDAESMDQAATKAKHFQETMKTGWGEHEDDVIWMDTYAIKESVEQELNI